jgi:flagellar hook assembly protein FlgD
MRKLGKGKGALLIFAIVALSAMWITWAYAAPSISAVSVSPSSLNATGSTNSTIRFTLSEAAHTDLTILDASDTVVKTVNDSTLTLGAKSKTWNGKNTAGTLVSEGTYTVSIVATSGSGTATDTSLSIFVDRTNPTISTLSVTTDTIESSSTTCDTTYTLSEPCTVTASVYSSSNSLIKTLANRVGQDTGTNTLSWNLKNTAGVVVPDGIYTIKVDATDASGRRATQKTTTVVMDCSRPTIDYVSLSKPLFSPTGSNSVTIRYTLTETSRVSVIAYNTSDTAVGTIVSETTKTAASNAAAKSYSATWKALSGSEGTSTVADGTYTIEFTATDTAGNVDTDTTTIVIDKTAPTATIGTLGSLTPGINTYLHIPITLSEDTSFVTVSILNNLNRSVKTLCSNVPIADDGATLIWDGKRTATAYHPAGTYTVKVVAKDAANNTRTTTSTFTVN